MVQFTNILLIEIFFDNFIKAAFDWITVNYKSSILSFNKKKLLKYFEFFLQNKESTVFFKFFTGHLNNQTKKIQKMRRRPSLIQALNNSIDLCEVCFGEKGKKRDSGKKVKLKKQLSGCLFFMKSAIANQ